jgi:hypothetical protein
MGAVFRIRIGFGFSQVSEWIRIRILSQEGENDP